MLRGFEMIRAFREFISKGNFVDIAVAFVMGAAFGSVVTALTERIVSPLIGMIVTVPSMDGIGRFGSEDPATSCAARAAERRAVGEGRSCSRCRGVRRHDTDPRVAASGQ
jgi:hypothetical protein